MKQLSKEKQLAAIIENDKPDVVGIPADEYFFAGWQYEFGIKARKDFCLAIKAYEIALSKGYVKATKALGDIYKKCEELEAAYRWYLEGCLQEEPDANSALGLALMYHEGNYVPQNYSKALRYFELAYDQGSSKAAYYLGMYYENGLSVGKDVSRAFKYYATGAESFEDNCREAVKRFRRVNNE